MSNSKRIAGLMGPVLVVSALSFLFNGDLWNSIIHQPIPGFATDVVLAGLLMLVAGIAIVRAHPHWTGGWRVLITVLGWFSILAGVLRTVFPAQVIAMGQELFPVSGSMTIPIVICGLIGLFLTYKGFGPGDVQVPPSNRQDFPRLNKSA